MSTSQFYDDLAEVYDLIYADWDKSMAHQGQALARMLEAEFPERVGEGLRILDVSAGIGTQSLPLAKLGHRVTARDLSSGAISRLRREAEARGLSIDAAAADMRFVSESTQGPFDSIIAIDNSVPHLQTDEEIAFALRGFYELLAPGGAVFISVRDYEKVDRTPKSSHPYGERSRSDKTFRVKQHWEWLDPSHYRTTFVFEELRGSDWVRFNQTSSVYYAIPVSRILELMEGVGFVSCGLGDIPFFQPVLKGCVAA
jgi:SAM-dependent methyltransferase